jgi:hypothetical protein
MIAASDLAHGPSRSGVLTLIGADHFPAIATALRTGSAITC